MIEEVLAGQTPHREVGPGQATRIMTGAPMPAGADSVVMVEQTELLPSGRIKVNDTVAPGKNVLPRGTEMKAGERIFGPGVRLRPEEVGVLAGLGKSQVKAHPRPTVAVVPTGDEIVEVWEKPGPGQIRNSNGRMLLAQVARGGGVPRSIGIAHDNRAPLTGIDRRRSGVGRRDPVGRRLGRQGRLRPGRARLDGRRSPRSQSAP